MSFWCENKLLFRAVGIALSSAAAGFLIIRVWKCRSSFNAPFKVNSEHSPVTKYVLEYGICEPSPLTKLRQAGVESKIDLRMQSAITTLAERKRIPEANLLTYVAHALVTNYELIAAGEAGTFDLVFIDADRTSKDQYYEKSLQLIRKGGLIVIDNVLCNGRVCDPGERAADRNLKASHDLNVKIHEDPRVVMCLIPFADGVTIAMKL